MPNQFSLTPIEGDTPTDPVIVDNKMRSDLGYPPSTKKWLHEWYNLIGLELAHGRSYDQIREFYKDDPDLVTIIDYIAERYTPRAWYSRR